jgi:hypothetical protein
LYERARFPARDADFRTSSESLAVLARHIVHEFEQGGRRRIEAVVTLNADDLLEQAIQASTRRPSRQWVGNIVRTYARASSRKLAMPGTGPIPIYHIHGFVPANLESLYGKWPWRFPRFFDHNLVFTDKQYWATSASASTFANRVMTWMLSETRCLFIGLSMTDVNLLRWFALRTIEVERDMEEVNRFGRGVQRQMGLQSSRHVWVRANQDDPTGFLSEFLALRGIRTIEIAEWSDTHFAQLMQRCFPRQARKRA